MSENNSFLHFFKALHSTSRKGRILELRKARPINKKVFPIELKSSREPRKAGIPLDPTTAVDKSGYLARVLTSDAAFQEHESKTFSLDFSHRSLEQLADFLYTGELTIPAPHFQEASIELLQLAGYLEVESLVEVLLSNYLRDFLFSHEDLNIYHGLDRWLYARYALRVLPEVDATVYRPMKELLSGAAVILKANFDAILAFQSTAAAAAFPFPTDPSDFAALLSDFGKSCAHEMALLSFLYKLNDARLMPDVSLLELVRRHLKPWRLPVPVLAELLEKTKGSGEVHVREWLYDVMTRKALQLAKGEKVEGGQDKGRKQAKLFEFTVEFRGLESLKTLRGEDLYAYYPFTLSIPHYPVTSVRVGVHREVGQWFPCVSLQNALVDGVHVWSELSDKCEAHWRLASEEDWDQLPWHDLKDAIITDLAIGEDKPESVFVYVKLPFDMPVLWGVPEKLTAVLPPPKRQDDEREGEGDQDEREEGGEEEERPAKRRKGGAGGGGRGRALGKGRR